MRQYGLDVEYSSLTDAKIELEANISLEVDIPVEPMVSVFDALGQGYAHDKALSAYVGDAFDVMTESVLARGSIDIEDDTVYCCACGACSDQQEAGPVMIDGFVTLASLLDADISYSQGDASLGDVLEDVYGLSLSEASQYLFDPETGQFVLVEGFTGQLTKGATLSFDGNGNSIVNAGGSSPTATAAATGDQRIDAVINGDYWAGASIDYAFSLSAAPYDYAGTGNEAMPDNFNDVISAMQEESAHFALSSTEGNLSAAGFSVEGFTNLDINFLGNVDSTTAEIRFAETADPGTGTARVADFPGGQVTSSANDDGDIWFGVQSNFRIAEAGNYQWMTMIHEIGHALGLKHGHSNYNYGVLPSDTDSTEFSIMTYRSYIGQNPSGGATNEQWGFPQTFMMYDIATLQYFYGADFNVNSGDTVYSWTPNSGDTFIDGVVAIEPGGNRIYATIWDGDGVDTYDLSAYDTDLVIDLSPGGFSIFSAAQQAAIGAGNFARGNIFNALQYEGDARSLIENAIGGIGDDSFVGNAADNVLDGDAGNDSADYSMVTDDLTVTLGETGSASSASAGNDSLLSIENFTSGDGNDTITGSSDANVITGGGGNDVITGLSGDDVLWGEIGNDTLEGGDGNDVLRGGNDLSVDSLVFGSGAIARALNSGANSIATALNIDDEFSLDADPDIVNATTTPHVSITAEGDGDVHYYAITILEDGANLTLDIDYGSGGAGGFNSQLDIYDSAGNLISTNNFAPSVIGAGGSTSNEDAYISAPIATAGVYYIAVSSIGGAAVPVGATYELQVSLDDTANSDPDSGDDSLNGGNGDDMLFGGLGTDTAVYIGNQADFTVTDNMDGTYTVTDNVGTEGTDILDNIEFLEFADGTVDIVTATGGMGTVPIDGTPGDDNPLLGTADDDVINGLSGDDTIAGLEGNDTLNGDEGDDFLEGGAGSDILNGGADFDLATYSTSDAAVTVNLATGAASGGHAVGDTFISIEGLSGSAFDDTLTGDANGNVLSGEGGNDVLDGGASEDSAAYLGVLQSDLIVTDNMDGSYTVEDTSGTHGTDTLTNIEFLLFDNDVFVDITTLVATPDSIEGTAGNDNLSGTSGDDVINGLAGNDILDGLAGDDTLNGGDGADRLLGGAGADAMNGGAGFDSVDYRGATSRIAFNVDTGGTVGDAAGDTYSGIERYYLSNFNDSITGSDANEFFYGEDGNDTINAGGGIDRLYGGDGNDIQRGQEGNDQLYGSAGNDQLNGGAGFDIANYTLATAAVVVNMLTGGTGGDAAGDTYFGIEAVYGSDFADSLTGNNSANELRGGDGDDMLFGLGGNDRFFGGEGADSFDGGTGIDIVNYTLATDSVSVNLTTGGSFGEAMGDSYTSIEWVFGSAFDDTITGDSANNRLEGRDGDDFINGEGGNDRLLGGDGDDIINGGDGVDTIFGGAGDDDLDGGAGNDFFFGGEGADFHHGGTGLDTVSYLASSTGLTIDMSSPNNSTGDALGDDFVGIERIFGSGFDDILIGGADSVTLIGNGGNDYLEGGDENDSLIGGAGVDSYGFDENGPSADVILGFTTNEVIYLLGNSTDFDTWAEVQAVGTDSGANVIFDFGFGTTLTIVGQNLADLDASNFDFSGNAPSAPSPAGQLPAEDPEADLFGADMVDTFNMDALI